MKKCLLRSEDLNSNTTHYTLNFKNMNVYAIVLPDEPVAPWSNSN